MYNSMRQHGVYTTLRELWLLAFSNFRGTERPARKRMAKNAVTYSAFYQDDHSIIIYRNKPDDG